VAAFAVLYEQHALEIHDFLLRTLRNDAAAEDLTQTTFLRAFERRSTLSDPGKVRPWLFSIAHHLALNQLSRSRPTDDIDARYELAAPERGPEDQAIAQESAELVWAAARSLEPRQYAVLDLATRHQMTTPEIAAALELENSHAAVLVHRAREALGNAVQQLLVARRRTHCERLAELVPAGVSELTPEQRASVDHHMRRCPNCQAMAARLTEPAVILGGIALVAMPALLNEAHRQALRSALPTGAHLAAPPALPPVSPPAPPFPPAPHAANPPLVAHHALRAAWIKPVALAAMAVVVIGASVGVAKVLTGSHPGANLPGSPTHAPRPPATTSAIPSPNPSTNWSIVSSPNPPGSTTSQLYDVTCVTAADCWAVGHYGDSGGNSQALIEQNTGTGWRIVSSPNPSGSTSSVLLGVTCVGASDCWAVGYYGNSSTSYALIEQNAGSGWDVVPTSGDSGNFGSMLNSVTCLSATDCWAVGSGIGGTPGLIEQDTGSGWVIVSSPMPPGAGLASLDSVTCVNADDCWAVGNYITSSSTFPSLVEQDTGSGWSIVPSPSPGSYYNILRSVSCIGANDCWTVGSYQDSGATGASAYTLMEQDTGSGWTLATSPALSSGANFDPFGVSCSPTDSCWAVGGGHDISMQENTGSGWALVSNPASPLGYGWLEAVTCVGVDDCWAVGLTQDADGSIYHALIEQAH
jgi:RNA polymerase sigma factor (sigma-70 family)